MKKDKAFIIPAIFSSITTVLLVICYAVYKINFLVLHWRLMLFPVIVMAVSWFFCFVKRLPKFIKYSVAVLCLLLSLGFYGFNLLAGYQEFRVYEGIEEIAEYNENVESGELAWRLLSYSHKVETEEYGSFSDITYYVYHFWAIFTDHAYTIVAEYSDEEFEKTVKEIENEYAFALEPVLEGDAQPFANLDGFEFRLVADENLSEHYPKYLYVIGINRDTREIAHINFSNKDLDGLFDFEYFVESYCGWYWIRNDRN